MSGAGAPLLGTLVAERYLVEEYLGEGGMGMVYLARHVTLEKQVALKVLHGEFSRKPDLVERFLQEAKSASRIRNPHIIDITDFGVAEQGFVFFAMEFLEGRDLHALLHQTTDEGGLLPWRRTRRIFLQVCSALSAAHEKGVIHRDLKPENIFLVDNAEQKDYVKLLDFGIAKMQALDGEPDGERKLTKTGMIFGTPEYMAPEQAKGEQPDHRVDVYAMGCLLYQMVTGAVPFSGDSFMAVLAKHMASPVPAIDEEALSKSGAPPAIVDVIMKALAKDRGHRYSDMAELAEAVREAGGRRTRASSHTPFIENWTGSVRLINDIAEDEERLDESETKSSSKWLIIGIVVAAVAVGGVASAVLGLGKSSLTPGVQKPSPTLAAPVEPTSGMQPVAEAAKADAGVAATPKVPVTQVGEDEGRRQPRPRKPRTETDRDDTATVAEPRPLPMPEEKPEEKPEEATGKDEQTTPTNDDGDGVGEVTTKPMDWGD